MRPMAPPAYSPPVQVDKQRARRPFAVSCSPSGERSYFVLDEDSIWQWDSSAAQPGSAEGAVWKQVTCNFEPDLTVVVEGELDEMHMVDLPDEPHRIYYDGTRYRPGLKCQMEGRAQLEYVAVEPGDDDVDGEQLDADGEQLDADGEQPAGEAGE